MGIPNSAGNGTDYKLVDGVLCVNPGFTGTLNAECAYTTDPTREIDFENDNNSLHTQRKAEENGITTIYEYTLHGKMIVHLTKRVVDLDGVETSEELHFFYGAQFRPAFVEYNGVKYRYIHNLQGDIVAIIDSVGNLVVEYKYDAWGNSDTTLPDGGIGKVNPFRYRGYVWDTEIDLYYLRNRFYTPKLARFINADIQVHIEKPGPLANLFHYGNNSPIVNRDSNGNEVETLSGLTGILVFTKSEYNDIPTLQESLTDPVNFLGHVAPIYKGVVYSYGPEDKNVFDTNAIVIIMDSDEDVEKYMNDKEYTSCYFMEIDIPANANVVKALANIGALKGNKVPDRTSTYYVNNTQDSTLKRYKAMVSNCVEFTKYCFAQFGVKLENMFSGIAYFPRLLVNKSIGSFKVVDLPKNEE